MSWFNIRKSMHHVNRIKNKKIYHFNTHGISIEQNPTPFLDFKKRQKNPPLNELRIEGNILNLIKGICKYSQLTLYLPTKTESYLPVIRNIHSPLVVSIMLEV